MGTTIYPIILAVMIIISIFQILRLVRGESGKDKPDLLIWGYSIIAASVMLMKDILSLNETHYFLAQAILILVIIGGIAVLVRYMKKQI